MGYQICVSGAARGESVEGGKELAIAAGVAIAQAGHVLMSGATVGLPNYAAQGCKAMGGQSIGLSPAASKVEHIKKYHLPTESYDAIIYTGLHYVGRDSLLVASSDAVISIGGRFGTLHEFTIAIEMHKPIGILLGAGGISTEIQAVMAAAGATEDVDVIFDSSAEQLVKKLARELNRRFGPDKKLYND
jgi:uncharacterized protein (TIGR00725 family)